MTDEIDVLKKVIAEHEKALRLKDLNQEMHSYLSASIYWLLRYSEKYNVPLPKKDELTRILERSDSMVDTMTFTAKKEPIMPNLTGYDKKEKFSIFSVDFWQSSINRFFTRIKSSKSTDPDTTPATEMYISHVNRCDN